MTDTNLDPATLSATVREMFPPPPPLVGWLGFYYDSSKDAPEDAGWYCSGKVHPDREEALCELAGFRPFEGSALVEVGQASALSAPATEKGASVIVGSHHWFDPVIGRVVSEVITEPAPPSTEKRSTDPDCGPYTHHWDFGFCHTCKKPGRDQGDAPATEKAVCPNCKRDDTGHSWKVNGELRYSCASTNKPAPPEPAAREMPEAVRVDHGELPPRTLKAGESVPYDTHRFLLWLARWEPNSNLRGQLLDWAEALEVWRRTHAAQPVAVGMTEELSMVLLRAEYGATEDERNPNLRDGYVARLKSAIETVRQQAAQGKPKVELPTARKTLEYMRRCAWADATYEQIDAALSELDAVEGRK